MTDEKADELRLEYRRLEREMEKARNRDLVSLANSFENSMARIADKLQKAGLPVED